MILIELEFFRQFAIYGRPELIFVYFYCHWSLLVLRKGNGVDSFLHGRYVVMQGVPLSIVV